MAAMRLNSHVQQYGGFTPGGKSFRHDVKIIYRGVGNPFLKIL